LIPSWWQFTLLAAAAYRLWRLVAEDTILDRPRAWLLGAPGWSPDDGDPPPGYRQELAVFLTCGWCMGFWLSVLAWGAWLVAPHATLVAATPFAISAVVGALAAKI
jgi:hypothetical protein